MNAMHSALAGHCIARLHTADRYDGLITRNIDRNPPTQPSIMCYAKHRQHIQYMGCMHALHAPGAGKCMTPVAKVLSDIRLGVHPCMHAAAAFMSGPGVRRIVARSQCLRGVPQTNADASLHIHYTHSISLVYFEAVASHSTCCVRDMSARTLHTGAGHIPSRESIL